ncbi:MAG: hypothetical protein JRN15_00145 [Nitrososphaerota archaeon]|nr:hypothetical protein [Nitrososphaerota archaeon]
MIGLSKILTIAVFVLAASTASVVVYNQFQASRNSYNSEIRYSFSRSPFVYDFSCGENDYQIHFVISNAGEKNITNFSVSVTNPLCVGGNPILPHTLKGLSTVSFYIQTTSPNGTLTVSGNNTLVQVRF